MFSILKKEVNRFFSGVTGYVVPVLFFLICGFFLFVLPDSNIFETGYADLAPFFSLVPWILIFLVPAVTMHSYPEEYRNGTFEILRTSPVSAARISGGKYFGSLVVIFLILVPTLLYAITVCSLSSSGSIDTGAAAGSYLGLFFLAAVFAAVSLVCSAFTSNTIAAFLLGTFMCVLLYYGFNALSNLSVFSGNADFYIQQAGIDYHYRSISKGVIDLRDLIYFVSLIILCLALASHHISRRTP